MCYYPYSKEKKLKGNRYFYMEVEDMTIESVRSTSASINLNKEATTRPVREVTAPETADGVAIKSGQEVETFAAEEETSNSNGEANKTSIDAIKKAVNEINKTSNNSTVQFGIHEKTNRMTVKILDKETKKVIKEFPAEKTLDLIAKAWEIAGLMVDEKG